MNDQNFLKFASNKIWRITAISVEITNQVRRPSRSRHSIPMFFEILCITCQSKTFALWCNKINLQYDLWRAFWTPEIQNINPELGQFFSNKSNSSTPTSPSLNSSTPTSPSLYTLMHLNSLFLTFVTETISRNNNCPKTFLKKWIIANYLSSIW